jgi:hypothetical protein
VVLEVIIKEAKELVVGIEETDDEVDVVLWFESKDCVVEEEDEDKDEDSGNESPTPVEDAEEAVFQVPGLAGSVVVAADASVVGGTYSPAVESAKMV